MSNVIVQGVFVVEPGERDRFIEASIEGMRDSRAEAGCLEYVLAADPLDPGRVILSERWESMEMLQQHLKALGARPAKDRPKPTSTEITLYEVTSAKRMA
jgi:quinol monooxygenase YgiN